MGAGSSKLNSLMDALNEDSNDYTEDFLNNLPPENKDERIPKNETVKGSVVDQKEVASPEVKEPKQSKPRTSKKAEEEPKMIGGIDFKSIKSTKKEQITVYLKPEIKAALDKVAKENDTKASRVVEHLLEHWLSNM